MINDRKSYLWPAMSIFGLGMVALLLFTACGEDPSQLSGSQQQKENAAPSVELADRGQARLPIVIGADADEAIEVAARELAEYLEKISDAPFEVIRDTGHSGIVLGRPDDFEDLPVADIAFGDSVFELEDYAIRTTEDGLYVLGSTALAVRFAVWDLLYRFGHRQFFPTETWEVVPKHERLSIAIDVQEAPDYYSRQAPRGAMRMDLRPWAQEGWIDWQLRNRTTPTFSLSTGHAYDTVIAANQAAFDGNAEYWGMVDGVRSDIAQPNVAHEAVQQMFIDHALDQFDRDPHRHSVAMDPRDGNFWSESPESLQIGGPSEQAVFLANRVAEAVVDHYGEEKYVGMYGYSHHSPPPQIDVHPNVIVSLATEYIRGGYSFEEMIDGWSQRANMIGIREYYGLWEWHYSLPGHGANAADTKYLQETIPHFHKRGARFINAESNDTWGGYGLGYYLAARMLWDVDEAGRIDELIDDFLKKAFGDAKEPMRHFYELIDGSAADPNVAHRRRPLNDDMVGRMYRHLDEARRLADGDEEVIARIDDLILYTHYVELFRRFDSIEGPQRQEAFDELVSFAWRIRHTMMAESVELTRYIDRRVRTDEHLQWGPGYSRNEPAHRHRVDEDLPFTEREIRQILSDGIAGHELLDLDFDAFDDSGVLEPAPLAADTPGTTTDRINRGPIHAVIATDDGAMPTLTISAGHIFTDRGPLQWILTDRQGSVLDYGQVAPNEEQHHFELSAPGPGVYELTIENTSQGFVWNYESRGAKMTLLAGGEHELKRNWFSRLYFYVPLGTDEIFIAGTLMEGRHEFVDGAGRPIDPDQIEVIQDYTIVAVPEGQDGAVWSLELRSLRPGIRFLNIPGYVALSPDQLLLPTEVVQEVRQVVDERQ